MTCFLLRVGISNVGVVEQPLEIRLEAVTRGDAPSCANRNRLKTSSFSSRISRAAQPTPTLLIPTRRRTRHAGRRIPFTRTSSIWMAATASGWQETAKESHLRSRGIGQDDNSNRAGKELINHIQKRRKVLITAAERAGRLRSPEPCSRTFGRSEDPSSAERREVRSAMARGCPITSTKPSASSIRAPFWRATGSCQSSRGP